MLVMFPLLMLVRMCRRGVRVFMRVRFVAARMRMPMLWIIMGVLVCMRDLFVSVCVRMFSHDDTPYHDYRTIESNVCCLKSDVASLDNWNNLEDSQ